MFQERDIKNIQPEGHPEHYNLVLCSSFTDIVVIFNRKVWSLCSTRDIRSIFIIQTPEIARSIYSFVINQNYSKLWRTSDEWINFPVFIRTGERRTQFKTVPCFQLNRDRGWRGCFRTLANYTSRNILID